MQHIINRIYLRMSYAHISSGSICKGEVGSCVRVRGGANVEEQELDRLVIVRWERGLLSSSSPELLLLLRLIGRSLDRLLLRCLHMWSESGDPMYRLLPGLRTHNYWLLRCQDKPTYLLERMKRGDLECIYK